MSRRSEYRGLHFVLHTCMLLSFFLLFVSISLAFFDFTSSIKMHMFSNCNMYSVQCWLLSDILVKMSIGKKSYNESFNNLQLWSVLQHIPKVLNHIPNDKDLKCISNPGCTICLRRRVGMWIADWNRKHLIFSVWFGHIRGLINGYIRQL